ncbi:MAG TPA: amidohydrolase family protein [Phycisphaerae bacterium]|nr:amidohydrolase family protein [Phycisphaerae bacterium]
MSSAAVYRARWVIPARGPILSDGAVACAGGRIVRVGRWADLKAHVGRADSVEHFADAAILPGLVNAHTHLALSDMAGKFRPTKNFAAWIARLTARMAIRGRSAARRAAEEGARLSLAAGTTAGADLAYNPADAQGVVGGPARWTVFGELFRFGRAGLERLGRTVAAMERLAAAGASVGLAPHAPYSAGVEVFVAARHEARKRGWPVSAHLHETVEELAFTECGEGPMVEWLRRLHLLPRDWRPAGLRPIPMLAEAGFFAGPALVAHGNYLTDEEVEILRRSGSSVVYCPRSHAFFGHPEHPWRRLLETGVNVCLGTDSLASSPSLSVLDEMRFLGSREGAAASRLLLEMATVCGARALGLEGETGDLAAGMRADLVVVGPVAETKDPLGAIVAGEGSVREVVVAGEGRARTCRAQTDVE